jgi:hypothetical protein
MTPRNGRRPSPYLPVRGRRREVAPDQIGGQGQVFLGHRSPGGFLAGHPADAQGPHQPGHPIPPAGNPLAVQGPPDLLRPIRLEIGLPDAHDLLLQLGVRHRPPRRRPALVVVVGGRGDLQHLTDRLDSELLPLGVDIGDDYFNRRSSSAAAKNAEAVRRISFARRSSRFSFSNSAIRRRSSLVVPGRPPPSISAWLAASRSRSPTGGPPARSPRDAHRSRRSPTPSASPAPAALAGSASAPGATPASCCLT